MKTKDEIEYLKQNWCYDPCWDLENTEGFEEYKTDLLDYRISKEVEWSRISKKELWLKAHKMGLGDNLVLAEYILKLESKIEYLEQREINREGR
jgi:hypothetical protein